MAEVFRAVAQGALGFRRMFVVKRILPQYSLDPEFVEMFVAEARLCALLHHPNVVHVIEFGQEGGAYYLAMEYLHGPTVLRMMRALARRKQALPAPMAAHVAREVAAGLDYAHKLRDEEGRPRGIVHRDVSPSNLILPIAGGVRILDFGIAKAENLARAVRTKDGVVKGKFAYTAPEQVRSGPVDHRADVWSLGVVLWEMLTGRRLFHGENEFETVKLLLDRPIPPPSALRAGIASDLDAVVLRALERERSRRYPTAEAMGADLENYLHAVRYHAADMPRLLVDLCGAELPPGGESAIPREVLERVRALAGSGEISAPTIPDLPPPAEPAPARALPEPPEIFVVARTPDEAPRPVRRRSRRGVLAAASAAIAATFLVGVENGPRRGDPIPPPSAAQPALADDLTAAASAGTGEPESAVAAGPASPAETAPERVPVHGSRARAQRSGRTAKPATTAAGAKVRDAVPIDPFSE